MSTQVVEQCVREWLESEETESEIAKTSKITYTLEFLLSFMDLDICRELPRGLERSILGDTEYCLITSSSRDSDNYSKELSPNCDSGTRCLNDEDTHLHSYSDSVLLFKSSLLISDSSRRYKDPDQCSWQNPEDKGLLGHGSLSRVSGFKASDSGQRIQEDFTICFKKSDNPYRPPHYYKEKIPPIAVGNVVRDTASELKSEDHNAGSCGSPTPVVDNSLATSVLDESRDTGMCHHILESNNDARHIEMDGFEKNQSDFNKMSSISEMEPEVKVADETVDLYADICLPDDDIFTTTDYTKNSEGSKFGMRPALDTGKESKFCSVVDCHVEDDLQEEICLPDEDSLITIDDLLAPYKLMNPQRANISNITMNPSVPSDEVCTHHSNSVHNRSYSYQNHKLEPFGPRSGHNQKLLKGLQNAVSLFPPPVHFSQQNQSVEVPTFSSPINQLDSYAQGFIPVHLIPVNLRPTSYQNYAMLRRDCGAALVNNNLVNQMHSFGVNGSSPNFRTQPPDTRFQYA